MTAKPIATSALKGLCPECGAATLFAGPVRFAGRCSACGLDFSRYNVGDGPAALLSFVVGGVVVALAIAVDIAFRPPIIVHALIWVPVTIAAVVGGLRVAKGALLVAEHRRDAGEARLADRDAR